MPRRSPKELEYRLNQVIKSSPSAIFVLGADHAITHWNVACEEMTGLAAEEMLGTRDAWRAFYDEPRPVLANLLIDGAGIEVMQSLYGTKARSSDRVAGGWEALARIRGGDRWVSLAAAPLLDLSGGVTGAVETLNDIGCRSAHRPLTGPPNPELPLHCPDDAIDGADLRSDFDRDDFLVRLQPRASLRTGAITGFQALLRWSNPSLDAVEWAIGEAISRTADWSRLGLSLALSLSSRHLGHQHGLIECIAASLHRFGAPPGCLELGIPENALIQQAEPAIRVLTGLGEMGVSWAMDEYGAGHASLSCLKRFPIRTIKIDRRLIAGLAHDRDDLDIVRAIVTMGHSLGLKIVAGGVETEEQRLVLAALGCDEIQGDLLGQPFPASELDGFMELNGSRLDRTP